MKKIPLTIIIFLLLIFNCFADTGLDFPGNNGTTTTMRFQFTAPDQNGMSIAGSNGGGVTYIWSAYYRNQTATPGYFTCFFYSDDDDWYSGGGAGNGYGFHPYPVDASGNGDSAELARTIHSIADGSDYPQGTGEALNYLVTYNQWYLHVVQIINNGANSITYRFYPDYARDNTDYIETTGHNTSEPTDPVIAWGDAPHNPGNEVMSGILRNIRIYSSLLSLSEIDQEIASVGSSGTVPWYYNLNPTPTDIADDSGNGNNPSWIGAERPTLYSSGDTTAPAISNGSPSGTLSAGTTQTTLSVTTDENATCKFSSSAGVSYASMPDTFSTTGTTNHSTTITGLTDGGSYLRYVRCVDSDVNANLSDYIVSWSIGLVNVGSSISFGGASSLILNSSGSTISLH